MEGGGYAAVANPQRKSLGRDMFAERRGFACVGGVEIFNRAQHKIPKIYIKKNQAENTMAVSCWGGNINANRPFLPPLQFHLEGSGILNTQRQRLLHRDNQTPKWTDANPEREKKNRNQQQQDARL